MTWVDDVASPQGGLAGEPAKVSVDAPWREVAAELELLPEGLRRAGTAPRSVRGPGVRGATLSGWFFQVDLKRVLAVLLDGTFEELVVSPVPFSMSGASTPSATAIFSRGKYSTVFDLLLRRNHRRMRSRVKSRRPLSSKEAAMALFDEAYRDAAGAIMVRSRSQSERSSEGYTAAIPLHQTLRAMTKGMLAASL